MRLRQQSFGRPTRLHKKSWRCLLSVKQVLFRSPGPKPAACCPGTPTPRASVRRDGDRGHRSLWPSSVRTLWPLLQVPNQQRGAVKGRRQDRAESVRRDEVLDELVRELDRFPNRHAEANEVFGVHGCRRVENCGRTCGHAANGQRCLFFLSKGYSRGRLATSAQILSL